MSYDRRPSNDECFDYHRDYVAAVPDGNILETLEQQAKSATEFIESLPAEQFEIVHAPFGWSVRTVLEHCCDAERVFGYRALRFATGDLTDLPGWDENHYAACGYGNAEDNMAIASEFSALRTANVRLLRRLSPFAFNNIGTADGRKMSVRTITWLMAGHWIHHEVILRKRLGMS